MRNTILLLGLLSVAAGVRAQQTAPFRFPEISGCPIGFGAQVNGRVIVRSVEDKKKNGDAPLLELSFVVRDTPKIVNARVIIHGLLPSGRYLPVDRRPDENFSQTIELSRGHGTEGLTNAEVQLEKMSLVRWAEVTELSYADGSVWHSSAESQCRAEPSKFVLVDDSAVQKAER